MWLKIPDSHLRCKVANKYLNVCEQVEVIEWNKRWYPPLPCCVVTRQCLWKKTLLSWSFYEVYFFLSRIIYKRGITCAPMLVERSVLVVKLFIKIPSAVPKYILSRLTIIVTFRLFTMSFIQLSSSDRGFESNFFKIL